MSDTPRLSTLIYKMKSFFKEDSKGNVTGISVSKKDLNAAVYPNNIIEGSGVKKIVVGTIAPISPEVGDIWIDIS